VISGYLITGMVASSMRAGTFSFAGFYFRRAKRLLPAAYLTFLTVAALSPMLLTGRELVDLTDQIIGAITFTANIVLWRQSGYFEGDAQLKPLLHVWSLSLEEQYYLVLPAALFLIRRRFWTAAACGALALSLGLFVVFVHSQPTAVFYLLPTRAWELLIGSVGVLALDRSEVANRLRPLLWLAVGLVLTVPALQVAAAPSLLTKMLVCLATLAIILIRSAPLSANAASRVLAWIGDASYSIYLVHWPLFALANNVFLTGTPLGVRLTLVGVSLALGFLSYRFVETPFRSVEVKPSRAGIGTALVASVVLGLIPFAIEALKGGVRLDYAMLNQVNRGFDKACDYYSEAFVLKPQCSNSDSPTIIVWGDSFAEHLVLGVAASTSAGVMQATRSVCGPFVTMAPFDDRYYTVQLAESCLAFNRSVLSFIAESPSVQVVALSSPFVQYVGERGRRARAW
jgi:peptidoglycan/LPS O-acetylase OafA/YrhL